jgi:hypothetical protein
MLARPANERYHSAGLVFFTLGAILVLFVCHKLKIHFPAGDRASAPLQFRRHYSYLELRENAY